MLNSSMSKSETKYSTSKIYVGVLERESGLFFEKHGLGQRPSHDTYYTGFIATSAGFLCLETGEVCPIFDQNPTTYQNGDYGHSLESIVLEIDSGNIPFEMTKEEIEHIAATTYKEKYEEFFGKNPKKLSKFFKQRKKF